MKKTVTILGILLVVLVIRMVAHKSSAPKQPASRTGNDMSIQHTNTMTTHSQTSYPQEQNSITVIFEGDTKKNTLSDGLEITFAGGVHATPEPGEVESGTYFFEFALGDTKEKVMFTTDESGRIKEWHGYEVTLVTEWPITLSVRKQ